MDISADGIGKRCEEVHVDSKTDRTQEWWQMASKNINSSVGILLNMHFISLCRMVIASLTLLQVMHQLEQQNTA